MPLGLSAQVTAAGISAPAFTDILSTLQAKYQGIFGSDIYIDPDSQDGQFLALLATVISDNNDTAIAVYNSFRPSAAQGAGLASVVKVNGIKMLSASYSTAPGLVVGQVGTTINNGVVKDANGNLWNLPVSVVIPSAGQISVTVTAQQIGAISAPSGTINKINTPTQGWQSFASTAAATPGAPVEVDSKLRQRQAVSTSVPAITPLGSMLGALSNLTGVQRVKVYENFASTTDSNGIPGTSICVVIQGGDLAAIAQLIGQKKTPGAGTYGSTAQQYIDPVTGIPYTIHFYLLATTTAKISITGSALAGYTSSTAAAIQAAVAAYINSHNIGETIEYSGIWAPGYLNGPARLQPYKITNLQIALDAGALGTADLPVPFNKIAMCVAATDVTVNIT
jgi:uncharacterized phage protein gp47/JayE